VEEIMAKAVLTLTNGSHKVIEPAKALRYYQLLHGLIDDPTPDEAEKAMHIKHVSLPPSFQPAGYQSAITSKFTKNPVNLVTRPVNDINSRRVTQTSLTNEGRLQGMSQAVPAGDQ
jgi:hypothetical protein